jgi:hypothetical protein
MKIKMVDIDEYRKVVTDDMPDIQIWNKPIVELLYGRSRVIYLLAYDKSKSIVAAWACPLDSTRNIRREYRILPYCSPWIHPDLIPSRRTEVVRQLSKCLKSIECAVDIPLGTDFTDIPGFLFEGISVKSRHTRILTVLGNERKQSYKASHRQHINHALSRTMIVELEPTYFNFERAIVTKSNDERKARRTSAEILHTLGVSHILGAIDIETSTLMGGIYLLKDRTQAIAMHSWSMKSTRGVSSLLVDKAIEFAHNEWGTKVFDFEGSVIPSIDVFMSSFGAKPSLYSQIQWKTENTSMAWEMS